MIIFLIRYIDTKSKKVAVVDPSDFKTIDSFLESKYKKIRLYPEYSSSS